MNIRKSLVCSVLSLLIPILPINAATFYVWTGSASDGPGTNWTTAFRTIQQAVDAAAPGDTVLVTNGVYETGGRAVSGASSLNRVVITKRITVRSVNGPEVTIIKGQGPIGSSAVRCVYMSAGTLIGFTLTNGFSRDSGSNFYIDCAGGGLNAYNGNDVVVSNCIITGCSAYYYGGAALQGTFYNCIIRSNLAMYGGGVVESELYNCALSLNRATQFGGGAYDSKFYNCTIVNNSAPRGGGTAYSYLYNCIAYYNQASSGDENVYGSTCYYTCTTPMQGGEGNIDADPQLVSEMRIALFSPCRGAGSRNYAKGVDIDGESWMNPPSMGCDEPIPGNLTGDISISIKVPATIVVQSSLPMPMKAEINGKVASNRWDFGDGTFADNSIYVSHTWDTTGTVSIVCTAYNDTYPDGISTTASVRVVSIEEGTCYVWKDSPTQRPPYRSWNEASRVIQLAVEACRYWGGRVLVTNGVYDLGGRTTPGGSCYNRVVITNNIIVQSVNGPEYTIIKGQGPIGTSSVRGVFMTTGQLIGFTITNGFTRNSGNEYLDLAGGGICVYGGNTVIISNCIIAANGASTYGGGVSGGILFNCVISNNTAQIGGGVSESVCYNTAICGNSGTWGGGAYDSTLYNCTVVRNYATNSGGGVYSGSLYNSIVYFNNSAGAGANINYGSCYYTCSTPLQSGVGNIDVNPQLLTDYRLAPTSPCLGKGSTNYIFGVDIDGEPWRSPPPMGCDEPYPENLTGEIKVAIFTPATTVVESSLGLPLTGIIAGGVSSNRWSFGDGEFAENTLSVIHVWKNVGVFPVVLTAYNRDYPDGISATVSVRVVTQEEGTRFVWANSPSPRAPYTNWLEAARTIQQAVDIQNVWGGVVLVTNGVYESGTRTTPGASSLNRLVITNNVLVKSVNGPEVTIIKGQGPLGSSAVRCVYMTAGVLDGFTLTNGFTRNSGDYYADTFGGGINAIQGANVIISNCIITGCSAYYAGGGVAGGIYYNCKIIGNTSQDYAGGVYDATLYNCLVKGNSSDYGGAGYETRFYDCVIDENTATVVGGGAYFSESYNSEIKNNSSSYGGGLYYGSASNCVIAFNTAYNSGGGSYSANIYSCMIKENKSTIGAGSYGGSIYNSILTGNVASTNGGGAYSSALNNCIITNNVAESGGGIYEGSARNCFIANNMAQLDGGGSCYADLVNCIISNNVAEYGGGAGGGSAVNCLIINNEALSDGGGANSVNLINCTISANRALSGGGAANSQLLNCIVYFNEAGNNPNVSDCACSYTCLSPLQTGAGNIDADPKFIEPFSGNYRLDASSPCIDAGENSVISELYGTDLDGNPRRYGNRIDMGAYEYISPQVVDSDSDGLPDWWEIQYSGSSTAMNPASDDDMDGMDNLSEFIAGTNPRDSSSVLKIIEIKPITVDGRGGFQIKWLSENGRFYDLESSWSPGGFTLLATNIPATPPVNVYSDTSRQISNKKFYRVRINRN